MNYYLTSLLVLAISAASALAQSKDQGKEPERLTSLRKSWQQARAKATDPIDLKYQQELQKMLDALTKSGDLEGALVVKQELEDINASKAALTGSTDTKRSLLSRLRNTKWSLNESKTEAQITFKGGDVLWHDDATNQEWTLKIEELPDGALLIEWGGADRRLEVADDLSSMTVARATTPDNKVTAKPLTKKR